MILSAPKPIIPGYTPLDVKLWLETDWANEGGLARPLAPSSVPRLRQVLASARSRIGSLSATLPARPVAVRDSWGRMLQSLNLQIGGYETMLNNASLVVAGDTLRNVGGEVATVYRMGTAAAGAVAAAPVAAAEVVYEDVKSAARGALGLGNNVVDEAGETAREVARQAGETARSVADDLAVPWTVAAGILALGLVVWLYVSVPPRRLA